MLRSMTYLITGGGSGGHIYPALAVADEIKKKEPSAKIILVGARRGMERKLFSETDYKSFFLPAGQLHSSVGRVKQLITLTLLPICFIQAFFILLFYRPKAVLGVGGYASGPLGIMSSLMGFPTYIWEANATPGMTNRILGKFNTVPLLVFSEASKYFKKNKPVSTGLPIRAEMEVSDSKKSSERSEKTVVLFVGGSQGAKVFNDTLPRFIKKYKDRLSGFYFIHQTGLKNYDSCLRDYGDLEGLVDVLEVKAYLDPMRAYYDKADLVVCRSGASTVVELSVLEKPSILVPFPRASDDHQKSNALSMVSKGAAVMIEEAGFNEETLLQELLSIKEKPARLSELSKACKSVFPLGAREKITDILLGLEK